MSCNSGGFGLLLIYLRFCFIFVCILIDKYTLFLIIYFNVSFFIQSLMIYHYRRLRLLLAYHDSRVLIISILYYNYTYMIQEAPVSILEFCMSYIRVTFSVSSYKDYCYTYYRRLWLFLIHYCWRRPYY